MAPKMIQERILRIPSITSPHTPPPDGPASA
jgi:hypothetical protein